MRNYKHYCDNIENVENYEKAKADNFEGWDCHHRLETHFSDGTERPKNAQLTYKELIALDMYYHRPAEELIFLTREKHQNVHFRGKHRSEETCKKISDTRKGKYTGEDNPMYGKHHSEETKRKISNSSKGKHLGPSSEEWRRKLSEARKGKHWFNNGVKNVLSKTCPEGFVPGIINYVR